MTSITPPKPHRIPLVRPTQLAHSTNIVRAKCNEYMAMKLSLLSTLLLIKPVIFRQSFYLYNMP